MDLITRVQSELTLEEKCLKCSKGILLKDNNKIDCLLALVSRNSDTGLIIFQWQSDTSVHDSLPFILYVLAIHGPFSIATVAGSESNKDIVRFQVLTDDQTKLVFEIKKDDQGKSFLTELNRAIEAYRQRAHMVGIPEFKWLERYQEMIGRKSFISSGGWPWNHLDEGGFSGSQVVVTEDEPEVDVFGMPGFSPASSIHPSVSVGSLFGLDDTDATANSSPALPRRSLPSTSIGARDGFIRFNMDQRENEFTHTKRMKIFIGTWNVNEQVPTKQVSSWLSVDDDPPDLFVLGFQELDLTADSFLKKDLPREEVWLKVMEQGLHPKGRYIKVKSIRLVGILLMVFIEKKHVPHVKDIYAESVATGIMGLMGNKGGVAVRLQIHNTTFCFVNSHLKAHLEEIERRNQDYKDILGKLKFEGPYGLISILDHKIIIWLGDLNYRIGGMDNIEARRLADKGEYEPLLVNDQLTQQRNQKKCFEGFHEGSITFKPTYRYDPGTDNWDTSEKCRIPAWCDRILWRTAPNVEIGLMKYRSHNAMKLSDHKPVSALFDVGVRVVDEAQERRVLEDVIRKLDRQENENLPQVQLGSTEIIFKDVKFLERQTAGLEIVNTGQVSAQFAFIAKLDEIDYCKPWLSVKPPMGVISPGSTKRVKIIVYVDKESARVMNSGEEKLEDILVLHLEGGKDFFVSVSGNYLPSVFGSSIEALVRMYGPIREVPVATLVDLEHMNTLTASSLSNTEPLEVPKELWLLTDHLFKFGMKEDNILRQNGLEGELKEIRTHLDCCKGGKLPGSIHAVAEALLIFLEALSEPVIPYAFYQRALECCNNYMLCKQLISQIPESHRNVFTYVSSFLRELLLYSDDNKLDAKTLATLIGTLFLRAPKNSEAGLSKRTQNQQTQKKARFMYHFLVNNFGPTR